MCMRIPVRLLGRMLKTSLNSGPNNTELACKREIKSTVKTSYFKKKDGALQKTQRHKLFQIAPYLVWRDLLLGRNKYLSPKSHSSRETPQSLQKGYPMVSNPTEISSGIPQSCFWGDPATKWKREQTSWLTTARNVCEASVQGRGSCLLKGADWGINSSCFRESGGFDCSLWLPAKSAKKNLDTRHLWVVKVWRCHQTTWHVCRGQGQWRLLTSAGTRMGRGDLTLVHIERQQGKFPPYTSQTSPFLCRHKPFLRVS